MSAKTQTTDSGLKITYLQTGKGEKLVQAGDKIRIHYTGKLEDGSKFDSSYDRGEPLEIVIGVGMVIKGWDEGVLGMKTGEKRILEIPYQLGYGDFGYPPVIPPKAKLIFDIELVEILEK